jgi:DNA polymerase-3 subunit epsilon
MREIILDTETTGLDPAEGHRIVEIAALELFNHLPTGRTFHTFINPQRSMPPEAAAIHGLDDAFLRDKPPFAQIAAEFSEFVAGGRLIIHNAAFDIRFLNAELSRIGGAVLRLEDAVDTLVIARQRFPGSPASLDALCRRFGVDASARVRHGALLDCELLAEVYLELVGGRQPDLVLVPAPDRKGAPALSRTRHDAPIRPVQRPRPLAPGLTQREAEDHLEVVAGLGPGALWLRYQTPKPDA